MTRAQVLSADGLAELPLRKKAIKQGGVYTVIDDLGRGALGPGGANKEHLKAVMIDARLVILASRGVNPSTAPAIEMLLATQGVPQTVVIRTEPARHAAWVRHLRRLSGSCAILHLLGDGVRMDDLAPGTKSQDLGAASGETH